jgi:hypothetical protein
MEFVVDKVPVWPVILEARRFYAVNRLFTNAPYSFVRQLGM